MPAGAALPAGWKHWISNKEVKTLPSESQTSTPEMLQEGSDRDREGTKGLGKQVY
jgi:hypothetical protein